ncbi:MAG: hypothetical protein AB2L24_21790 [Mangrovibacterium sp.]
MSKGMTIRVRMHPMYADFIRNQLGVNEKDQVFATERDPLGKLIKNLLRTNPPTPAKREYNKDAFIEFILPDYEDVFNDYRNYISESGEKIIAAKCKSRFYYELHDFIIEMSGSGLTELRWSIQLFCEQFGIKETSYKANSLEREYRRYRQRTEIVKKTRKIASSLDTLFVLFVSAFCPQLSLFVLLILNN